MSNQLVKAIKESAADTGIAVLINIPINFVLVSAAFRYELSAVQTAIMMTTVFTIIALVRKTYIRLYFHKKYNTQYTKE